MENVVPWKLLLDTLDPLYFLDTVGCRDHLSENLELMLRMYFVQQWYGIDDESTEDFIYDSRSLSSFVGLDLACDFVPNAMRLSKFKRWLEESKLIQLIDEVVRNELSYRGLLLREATLVDAETIEISSYKQNK